MRRRRAAARAAAALPRLGRDHSLLIAAAVVFLLPVVFIVLTSLMTDEQALSTNLWPEPFRWGNYSTCSSTLRSWRWALNSFIYSSLATLGLLVSSIPVAYAFARLRWRGREAMFLVVLVALMLPPQVTVVPLYVMWAKLHLVGTLWPLIMPNWLRRRVRDLPAAPVLPHDPRGVSRRGARRRLRRAPDPDDGRPAPREARDSCGRAVLGVVHVERLLPAASLRRREPDHWVASIGLAQFRGLHQVQWNLTMAATLLVMLPVIVLFFLAQQAFVEGVTLTGVKG